MKQCTIYLPAERLHGCFWFLAAVIKPLMYRHLCNWKLLVQLGGYLGVGLLIYMLNIYLITSENFKLSTKMALPFPIPIINEWEFLFLISCIVSFYYFHDSSKYVLVSLWFNICIYLMINNTEYYYWVSISPTTGTGCATLHCPILVQSLSQLTMGS